MTGRARGMKTLMSNKAFIPGWGARGNDGGSIIVFNTRFQFSAQNHPLSDYEHGGKNSKFGVF
jgi:hypothetical protein